MNTIKFFFAAASFLFFSAFCVAQCPSSCIVINEFSVDPDQGANGDADVTGEFIELYNACDGSIDIGCFVLCMTDNSSGRRGDCITIPAGTTLAAGGVFTMGGYTTNCTGGEADCDWPGLALDLNWHADASNVWSVAGDLFYTSNIGSYIGVLADGGEDITLFDNTGLFLWGVQFDGGAGVGTNNTENIGAISGCAAISVTIPPTSSHTDAGNTPGPNGADGGFERNCDGTWSDNQTASQNPGGDNGCALISCTPMSVELITDFTSQWIGNKVALSWKVKITNEEETTIILEKSTDRVLFKEIAHYSYDGTTSDFAHFDDLYDGVEMMYYRINIIDQDNNIIHSIVSSVHTTPVQNSFTVVEQKEGNFDIKIELVNDEQIIIEVQDISGKTIFQKHVNALKGCQNVKIPHHLFKPGTYILKIYDTHRMLYVSKLMR